MFFSLSTGGIIASMFEAAIITFVFIYLFGFLYNKLSCPSIQKNREMVKEVKDKGKRLYICEACGFAYEEKEWAENASSGANSITAVTWRLLGMPYP